VSNREDKNVLDSTESEPIDGLLALDRKAVLEAANERIAGGMYARIAQAQAECRLVAADRWRWALAAAAAACVALVVVWYATPARNAKDIFPGGSHGAPTSSVSPYQSRVAGQLAITRIPVKSRVRAAAPARSMMARQIVPRQATFPMKVVPTEQERLLMQLAAQQPKQLLAVAEAMADMRDRDDKERIDFEHWVHQKGGTQ
jgi:hypothetical protein